jgi:exodeoxyribonuclease VII large subunit
MAVLTVTQLARYLKGLLERDSMLGDVWISGEVSSFTRAQSGHAYFTLKDGDSQLRCVMFRSSSGSALLVQGSQILAHGHISFYEPRGTVDFIVNVVMPEGTGPLYLELEQLRARLELEGLFASSRKRSLPRFPKVIGVVTSPVGAVIQDIVKVIGRRYPLAEILLAPTQVQGNHAARGIVAALDSLNEDQRADVIIVARGGGSIEDLWPFNEESVARAIYASAIPVVSSVGHERDYTISDYVADLRAPTPSAAAEMVVPNVFNLRQEMFTRQEMAQMAMSRHITELRHRMDGAAERLWRAAPDTNTLRRRVDDLTRGASAGLTTRMQIVGMQVEGLASRIKSLDPASTLDRGYALVEKRATQGLVTSTQLVGPGDMLEVTVKDGTFPAVVSADPASEQHHKEASFGVGARLL